MTEPDTLEKFGAAYLRTRQLISDAAEAQWRMGATPTLPEDTTERSKGTTNDPTPTIVMDERRMRLRASVIEAEEAVANAGRVLQAAERHLEVAFSKWQG